MGLQLRGGAVRFSVLQPAGVVLSPSGILRNARNGRVEAAFGQVRGRRLVYRVERGEPGAGAP